MRRRRSAEPGFTLIELLVVLAVAGVVTALVAPGLVPAETRSSRVVALETRNLLRWAARQAAERGVPARAVIDFAERRYWIGAENGWTADIWKQGAMAGEDVNTIPAIMEVTFGVAGATVPATVRIIGASDTLTIDVPANGGWAEIR